jgi:DNA-binding transcriptional MerR regulator
MNASALLHSPGFAPEADANNQELLTIGEVSRLYGVTLRALRFYEQRDLLNPIRRGGARFYDAAQTVRLQMILKGKHLGFTLTEIIDLLDAQQERGSKAEDFDIDDKMVMSQLRHLEERRADLDQAITELRVVHQKLVHDAV